LTKEQHSMTADNRSSSTKMGSIPALGIRIEHQRQAFGIGTDRPRLSWIVETETQGWHQAAYEMEAYDAEGKLCGQTGRVESDQSVLIDWPFEPLSSRERVTVRARVWGMDGGASDWSESVPIEVGLLHPEDWTARFIGPDWDEDISMPQPAPLLRREFDVRPGVRMARLYITSLGVHEAQLNGAVVGDHVMAPGWTSYRHRLRYQTFDVTNLLQEGRNALGAMLGDGWFRGRLSFGGGHRNIYGDCLALLAQLEITYADGTFEQVITDDAQAWRAPPDPSLQRYLMRFAMPADAAAIQQTTMIVTGGSRPLIGIHTLLHPSTPVRRMKRLRPSPSSHHHLGVLPIWSEPCRNLCPTWVAGHTSHYVMPKC
jgi:alpha-L-rhamnosidase